jgi:hypothetical protein
MIDCHTDHIMTHQLTGGSYVVLRSGPTPLTDCDLHSQ